MDFNVALIIIGFIISLMGPRTVHQKAMGLLSQGQKSQLSDIVGDQKTSNLIVGGIIIVGFFVVTQFKELDTKLILGAFLSLLILAQSWLTYSLDKNLKTENYPTKFRHLLMLAGGVKAIGLILSFIFLTLWASNQSI